MELLFKELPKIELHAHLNGSLSKESIIELSMMKYNKVPDNIYENLQNFNSLDECFKIFKIAHDLTSTKELLQRATFLVVKDFALDNVIYLELRTTPKNSETMTKKEYLTSVLKGIELAKSAYPSITVKLLPSIDRSHGVAYAEDTVKVVLELLNLEQNRNIIKGIDLSGNPTNSSFKDFEHVLSLARENNLQIAIHCAEIENDTEVNDMLKFGMDRCGHGTFLKEQHLDIIKEKDIPIECCLSSNILCKTVKTYKDHHFLNLFQNEIPVLICTDDFGIFNTCLSNEFKIATDNFNLKRNSIKKILFDSVKYSFANEQEKLELYEKVESYFKL